MSEFTARYLSDYAPSDFKISTVNLTFNLDDNKTYVTSELKIERVNDQATELALDGEQLKLLSVALNGAVISPSQYELT